MKSVALFVVRSRIRNSGAANRRDSPVLLLTHKVAEVGEIKEAKKIRKTSERRKRQRGERAVHRATNTDLEEGLARLQTPTDR